MVFRQLFDSTSSTYTYLLADPGTREAILIDTVKEQVDRDLRLISELELRLIYVLDTHIHADHVTGAGLVSSRTGAKTVAGRLGARCADIQIAAGDTLSFGGSHAVSQLTHIRHRNRLTLCAFATKFT